MQEILDDFKSKEPDGRIFSKLSFGISMLTLLLFVMVIFSFPSKIKVSDGIPFFLRILIVSLQISCLIGLILTIISYMRKEKLRHFKTIGAVLNLLLFSIMVGAIIFSKMVGNH